MEHHSNFGTPDWLARLAQRAFDRCDEVARFSETPGGITRTFCSSSMAELHAALQEWMKAAGLTCRVDAAGNLFGRLESPSRPDAPALLIGSHLDSVPNAGKYDGVLGVMLGLALAEAVQQSGLALPFALEVVGFSEEEGVRFGLPFIGSRALVGDCDAALMSCTDSHGLSVADALRTFGCNPAEISIAQAPSDRYLGFLEPHIEQGPVLELEDLPVCIVSAIAGQTRALIRFVGEAGHAGTVPMQGRRDALVCAAEWIVEVQRVGNETPGLVATVGTIEVSPGAGNVIPGEATLRLDVRHADDGIRQAAIEHLICFGKNLHSRRQVEFHFITAHEHSAVAMNGPLTELLRQCIGDAGYRQLDWSSGAGHDAAVVARRFPTAMLFIRCRRGLSHHPDEFASPEDIAAALKVLWHLVERSAQTNPAHFSELTCTKDG